MVANINTNQTEGQLKRRGPERDYELEAKVLRFWNTNNYTKASIARIFKLSRERVRAIVTRYEKSN